MITYRKDLQTPLSADQVDNNFKYIDVFLSLLQNFDSLDSRVFAPILSAGNIEFCPIGETVISSEDIVILKLAFGSYFNFSEDISNIFIQGISLDFSDSFDGVNSLNSPLPFDCYLFIKDVTADIHLTYSATPIPVN